MLSLYIYGHFTHNSERTYKIGRVTTTVVQWCSGAVVHPLVTHADVLGLNPGYHANRYDVPLEWYTGQGSSPALGVAS